MSARLVVVVDELSQYIFEVPASEDQEMVQALPARYPPIARRRRSCGEFDSAPAWSWFVLHFSWQQVYAEVRRTAPQPVTTCELNGGHCRAARSSAAYHSHGDRSLPSVFYLIPSTVASFTTDDLGSGVRPACDY